LATKLTNVTKLAFQDWAAIRRDLCAISVIRVQGCPA
jgi:hypothetical protein